MIKSLNDFSSTGLDVSGSFAANGSFASPVIFTSLLDDSVMGDTNGDGAGSVPAPGDWDGLTISGGSGSVNGATFRYTGTAVANGLSGPSDLTVAGCRFEESWTGVTHEDSGDLAITGSRFYGPGLGVGLATGLGPNVTVQSNNFEGCSEAITMAADSNPVLGGNTAANCALNGTRIYSRGPILGAAATLSAHNNWWGEAPPDLSEIQAIGGGGVDVSGFRSGPARDTVKLALMPAAPSGIELTWRNVATCLGYRIQRAGDPQFTVLDIDLPLSPGTTSYTDATHPPDPIVYYRVTSD